MNDVPQNEPPKPKTPTDADTPAKRGRGRPRKAVAEGPPKVPGKRGRPRKAVDPDTLIAVPALGQPTPKPTRSEAKVIDKTDPAYRAPKPEAPSVITGLRDRLRSQIPQMADRAVKAAALPEPPADPKSEKRRLALSNATVISALRDNDHIKKTGEVLPFTNAEPAPGQVVDASQQAAFVERMAGQGMSADEIGAVLGIPKHVVISDYSEIMVRGRARANMSVSTAIFEVAKNKEHKDFARMATLWSEHRMGWTAAPSDTKAVESDAETMAADALATDTQISERFAAITSGLRAK